MDKRTFKTEIAYGKPTLTVVDPKHQRYTERFPSGAQATLTISDYNGKSASRAEPWTSIVVEELSPPNARGQRSSRTISITLEPAERAALIAILTGEAGE